MPDIAAFHPQIVHFVIAGAGLGIFFRWVSLTGKLKWTGGAATALIVIGTCAAWLAVHSGVQAHGVVERIPGAVRAVQEHEESGEGLRNILTGLAALELVLLVPALGQWRRYGLVASALMGIWAGAGLYNTGHMGGGLVYSYAGGVGTRSGDSTDVNRLVMAAGYQRATLSRSQQNHDAAYAAFQELAAKFPQDQVVQLLAVESMLTDKQDFAGARAAIEKLTVPSDTARTYQRFLVAKADALVGLGQRDSARTILAALAEKFPANVRVQAKLDSLK